MFFIHFPCNIYVLVSWTYSVYIQTAHTVADPAMGGAGAPPPIGQNLGLAVATLSSLPQTRGEFSFKSLTFGPFLVWKWTKSFQL